MKRWLAALALFCLVGALHAAHATTGSHDFRASLLVKGTISVSGTGTVTGYTLYQPDKLPKVVVDLLHRAIPTWRFHPAMRGGHPVAVTANMHVRLVATPVGDHRFSIRVAATSFADGLPRSREVHFDGRQRPPVYPRLARMEHVSGTVYVVLRINRRGVIDKTAVQEVDLTSRGGPAEMAHARDLLSRAALEAASHWKVAIPTLGPKAGADHWDARVPVTFILRRRGHAPPRYGQWRPYVPGPRQYIPWLPANELADGLAQPGGSLHLLGQGLRRIDPHGG